jgi:hypothetical protein
MAKITWLGDENEADSVTWMGINWRKGETLETLDENLAAKAELHKYFKVEGAEELKKAAAERKKAAEKEALGKTTKEPDPKPAVKPAEKR